jgi:phosphatidate cytidylyltransferase
MIKRIIVAIIGIPIVFLILVYWPPLVLAFLISAICGLAAFELLRVAMPFSGNIRLFIYTIATAALIPIGTYFDVNSPVIMVALLGLLSLVLIECIIRYNTERQYPIAYVFLSLFGGILIPFLLSTILNLRLMEHGRLLVFLPAICAFATDGGAYFIGKFFGKRKAFPNVSPKKTVEGCIGGIIIGTLGLALYSVAIINISALFFVNYSGLLIFGLAGAVACILGDLAFSLIKREFNAKDFGDILPGHGGILDRFDSMVFAAPTIFLLQWAMPLF